MATIIPFRGYRPPSDSAHKISSPPYDVMSSDEARDMTRYNPEDYVYHGYVNHLLMVLLQNYNQFQAL